MADAGEGSADDSTERPTAAREPQSLPERRFCGCQRFGNLHARAALVSCRGGEVLDELVGNSPPFGGIQLRPSEAQLVDDSDEGTRSYRGPDGEDSRANHSTVCLGDDDRRGGNEEQVAEKVGVVPSGIWILATGRQKADGGIEIGQAGASDVNLHEVASGAMCSERAAGGLRQG